VLTWSRWLDREAAAAARDHVRLPRVLGATEAWLLWRQCSLETAQGVGIDASDALIDALKRAFDLAADWFIPVDAIARGAQIECVWLARTMQAFTARCRDLHALPLAQLTTCLDQARTGPVQLAGFSTMRPLQRDLIERWRAHGSEIALIATQGAPARASIARTLDADDELASAVEWVQRRLLEDGRRRLLVVVPHLETVRPMLSSLFGRAQHTFAIEGGERLTGAPLVRHALTSLRFALAPLDFDVFSAWLRSPFWQRPDGADRARIDLWLRRELDVRVSWQDLLQRLASPPDALAEAATQWREHLERFAATFTGMTARANVWAERFLVALSALGFPGKEHGAAPLESHVRMRETLNDLASLDVALGELTLSAAIGWLERLIDRASFAAAPPDPVVAISASAEDPIVRYDGIWVTDQRAERWPAAVWRDPFIPVHAQLAAGVPAASATGRLAEARALLARWRNGTDELVLSWPSSADECAQTRSVLVDGLEDAQGFAREDLRSTPARKVFAAAPPVEAFDDYQGEPWPAEAFLPGGSRSIEHQIRCEFRAYSELRLRAVRLDAPRPGLAPRERGRLVHRALELLWDELRDSARLRAIGAEALDRLIAQSIGRAAEELLAEDRSVSRERALRRERRRVHFVLAALCAVESRRPPFAVMERETRRTLEIAGTRLNVRIDRVDRLEDGQLALIDYKSGEPRAQAWFEARPEQAQLLVYLRAMQAPVAVLATAHLATGQVGFRGIADRAGRLPRVPGFTAANGMADPDAWTRQLAEWNRLVDAAARGFAEGRAVRDPARGACTHCHLHALCRIGNAMTKAMRDA
jgi:ATP-dependent helicase/nuclease subunit B